MKNDLLKLLDKLAEFKEAYKSSIEAEIRNDYHNGKVYSEKAKKLMAEIELMMKDMDKYKNGEQGGLF